MHKSTYFTIQNTPYTATCNFPPIQQHSHQFFEISFPIKGTCKNVINNKEIEFKRHTCVIIRPSDHHIFKDQVLPNENKSIIYEHKDVYVSPNDMKSFCNFLRNDLYAEITNSESPIVFNIPEKTIEYLQTKLTILSNHKENSQQYLRSIFSSVVTSILCEYENSLNSTSQLPEWITDILTRLDSIEYLSIPISQLAKKIGYTPVHLSREFKKYLGETLISFRNKKRVNYAAKLMQDTNMKIVDISQLLGFETQWALDKHFKEIYGISPSEYRKQQNQHDN